MAFRELSHSACLTQHAAVGWSEYETQIRDEEIQTQTGKGI